MKANHYVNKIVKKSNVAQPRGKKLKKNYC